MNPSAVACPQCSASLREVRQSADSMLNAEQFDAAKLGDWFCSNCAPQGERYRYFWNRELNAAPVVGMPSLDPHELLEIARETGLRSFLHGVNATDAREILERYQLAVDQHRSSMSASKATATEKPMAIDRTPPFANCKFRECDLPGQCRGESRCHHPVTSDREAPAASGQKLTDEQSEALKHLIARGSTFPDHNVPNGSVTRVDYRHLQVAAKVLSTLLRASSATASDKGQRS